MSNETLTIWPQGWVLALTSLASVHGLARFVGRRDRAEHHPLRPRRLDRGARVNRERLRLEFRCAADEGRGARVVGCHFLTGEIRAAWNWTQQERDVQSWPLSTGACTARSCVLAVPYPNFPDKHLATPLVTPQRFLEYARGSGRLEGFEPPKGVLLIYKRSLMASLVESHAAQEETRIPQLTSAYRLPRTGGAVGLLGDFGIGGPVVSILVEEHAALDVTYFFSLGLAGGLQSDGRIGDIVLCTVLAVMDELHLDQTALVGWSDGACIALTMAMSAPARVAGCSSLAATWIRAA